MGIQINLKPWIGPVLRYANQRWECLVRDFPRLRTKLYSELISNILEDAFQTVIPGCRVGIGDGEADVYIVGQPIEIKTAAENRVWRGGDFSKRPGRYLLVGYEITEQKSLRWFVLDTVLQEWEWVSSGSSNYYATSVDLDYVLKRGDYEILWGDVQKKIKLTHPVYQEVP